MAHLMFSRRQFSSGCRSRRGYGLLVVVMLFSLVLLVLGIYLLDMKVIQYRTAVLEGDYFLARGIAEAGLEDARAKLNRDVSFPPTIGGRTIFSYQDPVTEPDTGEIIGAYVVTIDLAKAYPPDLMVGISSLGLVGDPENPRARRELKAMLDIAEKNRVDSNLTNPDFYKLVRWEDSGGL